MSENVKVRRKSDTVIEIVLTLGKEMMQILSGTYGPQSRRPDTKARFYDKMASRFDLGSFSEIIFSLGDFNGLVGK